MSSGGYETELPLDRAARRLLLGATAVAAVTGTVLLLAAAPAGALLKALLAALWLLGCAREAGRFRRGMSRLDRIQIGADGCLRGGRDGGPLQTLELLPGSVVGERWAWLRVRFGDGLRYGELLRERPGSREAWRRLRVIWRHRGVFGGPRRS
jgi:hypothetical protein